MCSREVKNSAYNMIVRPHLEYASTCWSPYNKRNMDKLEAVQRRAARFVLNFFDYHQTADLSGKIQKTFQWDSLQHRRADADLCMFHRLRNKLFGGIDLKFTHFHFFTVHMCMFWPCYGFVDGLS